MHAAGFSFECARRTFATRQTSPRQRAIGGARVRQRGPTRRHRAFYLRKRPQVVSAGGRCGTPQHPRAGSCSRCVGLPPEPGGRALGEIARRFRPWSRNSRHPLSPYSPSRPTIFRASFSFQQQSTLTCPPPKPPPWRFGRFTTHTPRNTPSTTTVPPQAHLTPRSGDPTRKW